MQPTCNQLAEHLRTNVDSLDQVLVSFLGNSASYITHFGKMWDDLPPDSLDEFLFLREFPAHKEALKLLWNVREVGHRVLSIHRGNTP